MNKKILVGSIIAVVILVIVSFSSVVGYQSVKSDSKIASPLFNARTSRAIDKESKDLTCDYIGKGEKIVIPLPIRDEKKILLQMTINNLIKMDEKAMNELLEMISSYLDGEDSTVSKLAQFEQELNYSAISEIIVNNDYPINNELYSIGPDHVWAPGCIIVPLLLYLIFIIVRIITYTFLCPYAFSGEGDFVTFSQA